VVRLTRGFWLKNAEKIGKKYENTLQYNTIQYNTIQYNTIQYNTIAINEYRDAVLSCLHATDQNGFLQYNTVQYNTIQ